LSELIINFCEHWKSKKIITPSEFLETIQRNRLRGETRGGVPLNVATVFIKEDAKGRSGDQLAVSRREPWDEEFGGKSIRKSRLLRLADTHYLIMPNFFNSKKHLAQAITSIEASWASSKSASNNL